MSVIIAVLYPSVKVADDVMDAVENLVRDKQLGMEDACAVIRDQTGRIQLHQEKDLSVLGAVSGFAIGTFLGWFIWLPYLGIPGALLGAMAGKVSDYGISDQYMKDLADEMDPGSSALFLLLKETSVERVLQELAPFGGRIFHTSLEKAQEAALQSKMQELQKNFFETQHEPPTNGFQPEFLDG